jgi:predicted Zn-dependent protease with MMP-like domain/ketosteroid isomerase-like protein
MTAARRPLADRVEVAAPGAAAFAARALGHMPAPVRRRALLAAFDRARDAFNRGDLEAVFALFAADVEYVPPPPLYQGEPLRGRAAVLEFWRDVFARYESSAIENLSLEEAAPGRFVRRARLVHRPGQGGNALAYSIVQTTELAAGRVVRQLNALDSQHGGAPVQEGLADAGATFLVMHESPELDEFESLVADAIDRLPNEFQEVLAKVPVVVSDLGAETHAYGQYYGDGVARERFEDRIVIYRDTLERDFGHDPELLSRQVERTLRHELAHHLGWGERGVGGLGL